ncbi:YxeA family protein [Paenibacillus sp. HJL G12]|uniref:YxeA family protein n=1 Tax=Paenibacillus dendrobii TaxID=2691084 RepID=A0A7X3IIJ9_9BACL|nr:YxeA family protein [Paenibacillus dendrobii]MWV44173.1 YxeA family protein [Paenibacillus dendrobii]
MKKGLVIGSVILVVLIGFVVFIQNVNLNRLGTDQYYVQIQDGKRMEEKSNDGKKFVYYEYTLDGFDKNGQEKSVTFTASKELRKEAYLSVYMKGDKAGSYQEVQENELPGPAKQKLERLGKK